MRYNCSAIATDYRDYGKNERKNGSQNPNLKTLHALDAVAAPPLPDAYEDSTYERHLLDVLALQPRRQRLLELRRLLAVLDP